jgi:hypothetical protein
VTSETKVEGQNGGGGGDLPKPATAKNDTKKARINDGKGGGLKVHWDRFVVSFFRNYTLLSSPSHSDASTPQEQVPTSQNQY